MAKHIDTDAIGERFLDALQAYTSANTKSTLKQEMLLVAGIGGMLLGAVGLFNTAVGMTDNLAPYNVVVDGRLSDQTDLTFLAGVEVTCSEATDSPQVHASAEVVLYAEQGGMPTTAQMIDDVIIPAGGEDCRGAVQRALDPQEGQPSILATTIAQEATEALPHTFTAESAVILSSDIRRAAHAGVPVESIP